MDVRCVHVCVLFMYVCMNECVCTVCVFTSCVCAYVCTHASTYACMYLSCTFLSHSLSLSLSLSVACIASGPLRNWGSLTCRTSPSRLTISRAGSVRTATQTFTPRRPFRCAVSLSLLLLLCTALRSPVSFSVAVSCVSLSLLPLLCTALCSPVSFSVAVRLTYGLTD